MNLAILIDAENILPSSADFIFNHASSLGTVVRREIYGAATALTAWVGPVLKYAIHPNLTIKAAKGKNSSDIALVIGAMDMLLSGGVDAMIIASSDSDFSSLSVRLRNAGVDVIGMGTDKANELWRTACSSFVVLQTAKAQGGTKPQAAQPAPARPEPAQPAPKPGKAPRSASHSHEERASILQSFIQKQLEARGGRIQTGVLFPLLNKLPEYQADKKGSGKKPLNYLTSTFGDVFSFEETADGNSWVSLPSAAHDIETTLDNEGEAPSIYDEMEPVSPAADEAEDEADDEADVLPEESEQEAEEASVPEEPAAPDPIALLVDAGLSEETARQIAVIFTESGNLRAAYNRLRATFGNTTGREYYQLVKDIAARQ